VIPVPSGVSERDAACAPIAFSTCSTCCSTMRNCSRRDRAGPCRRFRYRHGCDHDGKKIGCTVITTVATIQDRRRQGARRDHVINYRKDRFEHETRKITKKKGVDVVFEHVGADTLTARC